MDRERMMKNVAEIFSRGAVEKNLPAWVNNEPAQTVDVMVYGMQSGSETFSVHPCNESGNARNTVCDATH